MRIHADADADPQHWLSIPSNSVWWSTLTATFCRIALPIRSRLAKFPFIVGNGKRRPYPLHGVSHSIETTVRPVFCKARRLDPEKLRIAETHLGLLLYT